MDHGSIVMKGLLDFSILNYAPIINNKIMRILRFRMSEIQSSPPRKRRIETDFRKDKSETPEGQNNCGNVLLLTIQDALYPINTKLLEV